MIKLVALSGLVGGGILAAGNLSAAQWHTAGLALLALTLRYGLTVLPWVLAVVFAWRYWYWKRIATLYSQMASDTIEQTHSLRAELWEKDRALERATAPRRKRATR